MNLMKMFRNAAVAALVLSAGAANAALLQFNLTGDYKASWQLNSTGMPDAGTNGVGFVVYDVEGNFPGSIFDYADVYFFNANIGGGLEIDDFYGGTVLVSTDGSQLYTGSEEDIITFKLGTFALSEYNGMGRYTLTVTDLDAPPPSSDVPEPASAAILLGGLGLMAGLRRRRQGK